MNSSLNFLDLDDWRPLAASLPNYMKGISTVPQSRRLLRGSLKEMFKDHLSTDHLYLDHKPSEEESKNSNYAMQVYKEIISHVLAIG